MDQHSDDQQQGPSQPYDWASDVSISTTNENWRGKNDPTERRRIQNRLNQRRFRQRQRAGKPSKPYKRRSPARGSASQSPGIRPPADDDRDEESRSSSRGAGNSGRSSADDHKEDSDRVGSGLGDSLSRSPSGPSSLPPPESVGDVVGDAVGSSSGRVWDELAQIINRNLMTAAAANTQALGIQVDDLRNGNHVLTPRLGRSTSLPDTLVPVELQHRIPHDPLIDAIPHSRFRFNILFAIASQRIDATVFYGSLRGSGSLQEGRGIWQRDGLVVWDAPQLVESWEMSATFVQQWQDLLHGCDDLIAATNVWRTRRGERLFSLEQGLSEGNPGDVVSSLRGGGGSEVESERDEEDGKGKDEKNASARPGH